MKTLLVRRDHFMSFNDRLCMLSLFIPQSYNTQPHQSVNHIRHPGQTGTSDYTTVFEDW